jgi:iron complex transport system substrate-binding protein
MRIVSLLASGTEIVCALGKGEWLVGRSHECDNPPWVRSLPACTAPAFDISRSSREIDAEVRRRIRSGEPLYHIHTDLIGELHPDLLITQAHCDVCAVTPADVDRSGCAPAALHVLALSAGTLDGIFADIQRVARALGVEQKGRELVCFEKQRLEMVRKSVRELGAPHRPTLVMLEWTDPLFAMGNWGPELVEIALGILRIGAKGEYSRAISPEELTAADPDFIIVAPCGFDLERACREQECLGRQPWWSSLRAVRNGNVAFADGNLFFNRSGMTVSRTTEIIAEILYGVTFGNPSEGTHWRWARRESAPNLG